MGTAGNISGSWFCKIRGVCTNDSNVSGGPWTREDKTSSGSATTRSAVKSEGQTERGSYLQKIWETHRAGRAASITGSKLVKKVRRGKTRQGWEVRGRGGRKKTWNRRRRCLKCCALFGQKSEKKVKTQRPPALRPSLPLFRSRLSQFSAGRLGSFSGRNTSLPDKKRNHRPTDRPTDCCVWAMTGTSPLTTYQQGFFASKISPAEPDVVNQKRNGSAKKTQRHRPTFYWLCVRL